MEDMRAVFMYVYARHAFGVDITCDVVSFIDYKNLLACRPRPHGKDRTKKSCADN